MTFAEFSGSDEDEFADTDEEYSNYLTVEAYLEMHFGEKGKQVYRRLRRIAQKTTAEVGGTAGIIFNDEGGEFVSFDEDEEDY